MNFPLYIARRYLFSKKSHNAINIISAISAGGVALATTALVCTLSVFNGFHDLVATLFTSFDPELKITPASGKYMSADDPLLTKIRNHQDVAVYSECLEDMALARYNGRQAMITLKGVDDRYADCTGIRNSLYGNTDFVLHADVLQYGIPGIQLAADLGMGADFASPLEIYTPRPGERINPANPATGFNSDILHSAGAVFVINQRKYDTNYVLASLSFAQNMFEKPGQLSSLELKLKPGSDVTRVKENLRLLTGGKYNVNDRYEQQEDVFRIMEIEKAIAYLFLTFILAIACFNIIGSLSMLIIDKRNDAETLRNLGATNRQIARIFLFEGRLISTLGAFTGIILGVVLCYLQQTYGLLRLGDSSGSFIVDAYPVSLHITDILLIFATVLAVGYLSVWYPVRYLSRKLLSQDTLRND